MQGLGIFIALVIFVLVFSVCCFFYKKRLAAAFFIATFATYAVCVAVAPKSEQGPEYLFFSGVLIFLALASGLFLAAGYPDKNERTVKME